MAKHACPHCKCNQDAPTSRAAEYEPNIDLIIKQLLIHTGGNQTIDTNQIYGAYVRRFCSQLAQPRLTQSRFTRHLRATGYPFAPTAINKIIGYRLAD